MVKKLCTIFMLALMSAPLLAQTINGKRDGVMFAPQKGQWQFSMFLGGGNTFYNESTSYLLPNFTNTGGSVGLEGTQNGDMNKYLKIDGLNNKKRN